MWFNISFGCLGSETQIIDDNWYIIYIPLLFTVFDTAASIKIPQQKQFNGEKVYLAHISSVLPLSL